MRDIIGWDIGGVHLKAARVSFEAGRLRRIDTRLRYFEMWRQHGCLAGAVRELRRDLGGEAAEHALTMTAELADCFASRAEGVRFILAAAEEALAGEALRAWSIEGVFAGARQAAEEPLRFAASNWLATAEVAARCGEGLLIDVGSTTSDLVPLAAGRAAPATRDDTRRLVSGELVYTGVLRTSPAALAPEVPLGGAWCRLSSESFAFTADIYLVLGRIAPEQVTGPTADGRPATPEAAAARLARLVCSDAAGLGPESIAGMARFLESAQAAALERAARQVLSQPEPAGRGSPETRGSPGAGPGAPAVVATGLGRFLAAEVARRLGLPCRDLSEFIPLREPQAAPAACAALLLAEETLGARGPGSWAPALPGRGEREP